MDKKIKSVHIDKVGAVNIDVPLLQFGSGKPKVLILNGIHGDEVSGLFVIKELIKNLQLGKGQLDIITSANPLAQVLKKRRTPIDKKDLNRNFSDSEYTLTKKIAKELLKQFTNYDLVIDLHTFENQSPVVCIFINHGDKEVKRKSKQQINNFSPKLVWQLDVDSKTDKDFLGSLGPQLSKKNVPNFVVEMPEHFRITKKQISKVESGIKRVLLDLGMVKKKKKNKKERVIPYFKRKRVKAESSGIFTPKKELMSNVKPGDIIGETTKIDTFETQAIKSNQKGKLIIINDRDLIMPGDLLFSIGKKVNSM